MNMLLRTRKVYFTLAAMLAFSAPAWAGNQEDPRGGSGQEEVQEMGAAEKILPKMNLLNRSEIEAGRMGMRKACRREVREYGHHLMVDHSNNNRLVQRLAQRERVILSRATLTRAEAANIAKQKNAMARLRNMRSCAFDNAFLEAMVDAHRFAISVASAARADASVRAYLAETIPHLEMHLRRARDLQR